MSEKSEFFFEALDAYLRQGHEPQQALKRTVDDYAYVFFPVDEDTRPPLSRASERALELLEEAADAQ